MHSSLAAWMLAKSNPVIWVGMIKHHMKEQVPDWDLHASSSDLYTPCGSDPALLGSLLNTDFYLQSNLITSLTALFQPKKLCDSHHMNS